MASVSFDVFMTAGENFMKYVRGVPDGRAGDGHQDAYFTKIVGFEAFKARWENGKDEDWWPGKYIKDRHVHIPTEQAAQRFMQMAGPHAATFFKAYEFIVGDTNADI